MKNLNRKRTEKTFSVKWAEWVLKRKWFVLVASLLIAFGIGSGVQNLGFDADYHVFFSDENPELNAFDALQEKYTKDDNVLIALSPKDGKVFTQPTLLAIQNLTQEAWNTPFSSRVDAITNFQHTYADNDDLYVEDLVPDASALTSADVSKIKGIALREPLLQNRLINKDGSVTAINITVKLPGVEMTELPEVKAFINQMVADFKTNNPNIETHISGTVPLNNAFFDASQSDMSTLMPAMFLMVIISLLLLTRSVSSTISTLVIIFLSIITAMGAAGYLGIKLTPPTSVTPTIILTLAVADSIHIIISMLQGLKSGLTKYEAIVESVRLNMMPVFITSVTTIIGFLSMNFGDVPPFWDLGNMTAIGMTGALFYSITILPALLMILPIKVKVQQQEKNKQGWIDRLGLAVANKPIQMAILSSVMILTIGGFAIKNEFNDEFVKYFDNSVTFRTDTDYISDNLTGIYNVEFSIGAEESGGINNPVYLENLGKFEDWLNEQPEVRHVNAYTEIAKRVNKSMHGDDPSFYKLPTDREEAAQYLLLYEMSLPFGLDLNNQINVDKSETRVTITTENMSSANMIVFSERAQDWLKNNTPEYMHAIATSPTLMFSHLGFRQADSMFKGNVIALILISIVLMLALKSFGFGMLSIIPNVTPVLVGFGVWAMFSGQINTGMVVVFGMTLGIIVDDTVHFMSKFLRARREYNYTPQKAVVYAFSTVGKAIVTTTIVLLAGFAVLSQSSFGLNNGMARISTIIIFAALLIDFVLLPALLILTSKKQVVNPKATPTPSLASVES